ncbi:carboxyl-terminal protease [hydrocarbon metagenome]|uniref:Carboxyl-terminal protease n=1 Tax=hydrocarbon metagenome TaxID=938273 RepID=A0A0W8E666_9ZZZZ
MNNKGKGFLKGLNILFSTLGVFFVAGLIFILAVNPIGLGTLVSVVGLINTQSLYDIDSQQMLEGASAGIVEALDDPYSTYLDKQTWQELKIRLEAKFGGIGVYVFQDNEGLIKVYSPIKGTPAYEAGVQHGDIVTRINGESTMNMTQDDAVTLMRGDPGTQLELTIYREADNKEYVFKIVREIINVPSVEDEVLDADQGIGYIRLSQFHTQSTVEMMESVDRMVNESNIKGLILDLRNNGGGEFEAAIDIASIFLDEGAEVVSSADARGNSKVYKASAGKTDVPLVVLVNQDSASASEILAAALQDNERALLVGATTYGKGLVQTVFPLRDGGALKLTTQKYFTPNGTDINEIGIVPDFSIADDIENSEDVQLDKALEVLKQQM